MEMTVVLMLLTVVDDGNNCYDITDIYFSVVIEVALLIAAISIFYVHSFGYLL